MSMRENTNFRARVAICEYSAAIARCFSPAAIALPEPAP